jgi:hypothetical protein
MGTLRWRPPLCEGQRGLALRHRTGDMQISYVDFREKPECELRLTRFPGSCASPCNSSYLPSLINSRRGLRVSPSLKEEVA